MQGPEFSDPGVLATGPRSAKIRARASLAVVFPLLPLIATKRVDRVSRRRQTYAIPAEE